MDYDKLTANEENVSATEMKQELEENPEIINSTASAINSNQTSERNLLTDFTFFWPQFKRMFDIALPQIITLIIYSLENTITLTFVGRNIKDHRALNAITALDVYFAYILMPFVLAAMEGYSILTSVAFGARKYKLCAYYMHRSIIVTYAIVIPLALLSVFFGDYIFALIVPDKGTEAFAREFLSIAAYFVLFDTLVDILFDYLNIIEKSHVMYYIIGITVSVHLFNSWLFVEHFQMGIKGCAYSLMLTKILNVAFILLYINIFNPHPASICWFDKNSFKGLWSYLKVVAPLCLFNVVNSYSQELKSLITVRAPSKQYTANQLTSNYYSYLVCIKAGITNATVILIGKKIGQGLINSTKKIMAVSFSFVGITAIITMLGLYFGRSYLLVLYTSDPEVIDIGAKLALLVMVNTIPTQISSVSFAILQGLNKQNLTGSLASFLGLGVGLPLSALFFFYFDLGIYGIRFALTIETLVGCSIVSYFLLSIDLKVVKLEIISRLNKDLRVIKQDQPEEEENVGLKDDEDELELSSEDKTRDGNSERVSLKKEYLD